VARGQEVRLTIEEDRLAYWISKGAQTSDRVKQLVKEFRDPTIREKRVAAQQAHAEAVATRLAAKAKAKAKADEEAAAEAEAKAAADAEAKEAAV
jgi:small subunit ribosomal protein S16